MDVLGGKQCGTVHYGSGEREREGGAEMEHLCAAAKTLVDLPPNWLLSQKESALTVRGTRIPDTAI